MVWLGFFGGAFLVFFCLLGVFLFFCFLRIHKVCLALLPMKSVGILSLLKISQWGCREYSLIVGKLIKDCLCFLFFFF